MNDNGYGLSAGEMETVAFLKEEDEWKAWQKLQLTRAAKVLGLLRQHLPAEALHEVEDFLSTYNGSDCLYHELTGQWFW